MSSDREERAASAPTTTNTSTTTAVLLAAGQSRRMGAFKPLLPFGQLTVIETSIRYLQEAGVAEIVVVIGHHAESLRALLEPVAGLRFAFNSAAESEMSVSIARGVEQVSDHAEAVLIALVDHPAVPSEVPRRLMSERQRTGATLLVPEWQGHGGHPVLIDLKHRDALLRLDTRRGLRALFDEHRSEVRRVPVASPYIARDMDVWEDYRALHEEIFGTSPPLLPTH